MIKYFYILIITYVLRIGGPLTLSAANNIGLELFLIYKTLSSKYKNKYAFYYVILNISILFLLLLININEVPILEFITVYKILYYNIIVVIILFLKKDDKSKIENKIDIFLYILLLYYLTQVIINGISFRPDLILENNYELIPFVLYYTTREKLYRYKLQILCLIIILIIARSKSVFAIFLFNIFAQFFFYSKQTKFINRFLIFTILIIFSFSSTYYILSYIDLSNIDRILFFNLFLTEYLSHDIFNILVGNYPIINMNNNTCYALSYYEDLMSGNGLCYSKIFHISLLRQLIDFGIIGTILFHTFTYYILNKHFNNIKTNQIFISFFLSGLSVSGFGSVAYPITILLLKNNDKKNI